MPHRIAFSRVSRDCDRPTLESAEEGAGESSRGRAHSAGARPTANGVASLLSKDVCFSRFENAEALLLPRPNSRRTL